MHLYVRLIRSRWYGFVLDSELCLIPDAHLVDIGPGS